MRTFLASCLVLVGLLPQAAHAAPPQKTFLAAELPPGEAADLAKSIPNVKVIAGLDRKTALAHAAEADGVDARLLTPELIAKAPRLVWAHSPGAGVEWVVNMPELQKTDRIVLTNARGVHGPVIAEHTMAMLLSLSRNLNFYREAQREGRWQDSDPPHPSIALQGRTMFVVGIGGIGSEIAKRANAFGMKVIATRRTDAPAPDYVSRVGKPQDLLAFLAEADVVAITVPLTKETEHSFDDKAFAAMKKGAILLNVSRGKIVDTAALIRALKSGKLAGAGLDVTDPEPLPKDHPLWKEANVIITPHSSSDADLTSERREALFKEELRRFGAGEPFLNVVDKKAGY